MSVPLAEALENAAKTFADRMGRIRHYAEVVEKLLEAGVELEVSRWMIETCSTVAIKKADLSKVRSVVGRLQVTAKNTSWNFETSNELIIRLRPVSKEFNYIEFSYKTKFRPGGKCHVETIAATYTSLVCKV